MAGMRIVITIADSTLPEGQRIVLLEGLAADMADLLATYYYGIEVVPEDSYAVTPDGITTNEISGSVYSPYYAVYGGGDVYAP